MTDDMAEKVPALVNVATTLTGKAAPSEMLVKPIINSKKVSDHHAIIPTMSAERADLSALPSGERKILRMIAIRLLASVAPPYRYTETVAEFRCGEDAFTAKGKTVLDAGWKAIAKLGKAEKADDPLLMMQVGDSFPVVSAEVKEGQTKPKAH